MTEPPPTTTPATKMVVVEPRRHSRVPPPLVDPLDASLLFPRRRGAIQPPPLDLISVIRSYPENQQPCAVAQALGRVNVGASHVSVFGVLWRLIRNNLDGSGQPHLVDGRDRLLRDIHTDPCTFQKAVLHGCKMTDRLTGRSWYAPELMPDLGGVAKVIVQPGEVMDLWRWPATCASQQGAYALCAVVRDAAFLMNRVYGQILTQAPRFQQNGL